MRFFEWKDWQNKITNHKEEKVMRKMQSRMAAWVGLVALVYGVLGVWTLAQAGQAGGPVKNLSDLNCTAGQIPKFNGTVWQCGADVDTNTLATLSCTAGQIPEFNGTTWQCADTQPPRFVDNGDGTISDNQTGLMWEKKTACAGPSATDIHCVNNTYTWSSTQSNPDGTLFTDFLARINKALSTSADGSTVADFCFAGHCDWRAPNIAELRTILLSQFPCSTSPCIDAIFGPTVASGYWSSTTFASNTLFAFFVFFDNGDVLPDDKVDDRHVRAVRGGR
jgi:hypothetical protein